MATAWIMEASEVGRQSGNAVPVMPLSSSVKTVTYTTSTQSSALDTGSKFISIVADADAYVAIGSNPTATASSWYIPSGSVHSFTVDGGELVAVYDGSS